MLDLARGEGHPLVRANLEALPFCDNAFTGAFARHSYLHLSHARAGAALAELRRVLRPGGHVLLSLIEGTYEGHDLPGDDFPGRYYAFWTARPGVSTCLGPFHRRRGHPCPTTKRRDGPPGHGAGIIRLIWAPRRNSRDLGASLALPPRAPGGEPREVGGSGGSQRVLGKVA